ncbi:hypothetical protein ACCQ14_01765 [Xanthomonas sp. NCPPB 2865]|jgi:hypothetical protein|uniref:hypothetical protein n=1 Tax=unclassified Xanthomonas TaxID=2643310 RepID=UPI001CF8C753|nr:hypothetical protein [Xanthomonas sp. MWU16-30325]
MQKGISISKIWSDDDLVELRIVVADQASSFCSTAYVDHGHLEELATQLRTFRNHIDGGIKDIRLGEFGPEYANGAFHARLHFRSPGKLYVSTHQQSEFAGFSIGEVASEAKMYLVSEPVLLDNFIAELGGLANGAREDATLECI